jgi:hypothetical protein
VEGLFTDSKNVFNQDTLDAINDFDWFSSVLFFLSVGFTVAYLILGIWGHFNDKAYMEIRVTRIRPDHDPLD